MPFGGIFLTLLRKLSLGRDISKSRFTKVFHDARLIKLGINTNIVACPTELRRSPGRCAKNKE